MERKTALITGASRGIGRAIARAFAAAGYDLILTCPALGGTALQQLCRNLAADCGIRAVPFCGDIGDFETVRSLFSRIRRLDVLVNNAGISHCRAALRYGLRKNGAGSWLPTWTAAFTPVSWPFPSWFTKSGEKSSISPPSGEMRAASMETAYSASKGAVNSLTKALAKELAPSNIQVNAIACGVIDTDMNRCFSEEEMQALIDEIPADRLGTPEEVALLALQLAQSPAYLTGQVITLDGGFL